ncbi:(Fe-S)-binding protein [Candidatus Solincola sp.]
MGGGEMLIERIDIEQVEPCFADETKIRLIARIPVDVSELLPYLNAVLANATYVGGGEGKEGPEDGEVPTYASDRPALTFTKGPRLVTVYPRRVTIAKADDVADAEETLDWLVERLNYVHEHREEIEPVYEGKIKIKPLDIYGLLPQTNCRECGEQGCLAFALLLLQEKHRLRDCPPLYREERWKGKRERLEEVVASLGLPR